MDRRLISIDGCPGVETVTVGLASYNRPHLLMRAIESIKSQTYRNLEIIVSDNGSTDPDIERLIKAFVAEDPRVTCTLHPQNRGAFFSFRFLLKQAKGKYFIWLADDDYWCPTYIEHLLASHQQSGAALTYGRAAIADLHVQGEDQWLKEMPSNKNAIDALASFIRFDSDAAFYGIFNTATGQRLAYLLRDWSLPSAWLQGNPSLAYNFVSYSFLYGLLASGGYCNASDSHCIHFVGGRSDGLAHRGLGFRHIIIFLAFVWIHAQILYRFASGSFSVGSWRGVLFSPLAVLHLFFGRIKMIIALRIKGSKLVK